MPHFSLLQVLLAAVVIAAAATDLKSRRIPNWLTLFGVCSGLSLNFAIAGWPGLRNSLLGLLLGFGSYFALYALHAMGAGDVKLMAAVGALVGPANWFAIFIASAIAGGVFALFLIVRKDRVKQTLFNTIFIVGELIQFRAPHAQRSDLDIKDPRALKLPHGVAIAAGTLACLLLEVI